MKSEIMFAGFGGQGIVKAAVLLAQAAGLFEGKHIAQTQSYGPEARGGACKSEVVISSEEIDYIKVSELDVLIVMSQPALDKYLSKVKFDHTLVIYDNTLIAQIPPEVKHTFGIEATQIAEQEFGRSLFANIILLGVFAGTTDLVTLSSLSCSLEGSVPQNTLEKNQNALKRGFDFARQTLI